MEETWCILFTPHFEKKQQKNLLWAAERSGLRTESFAPGESSDFAFASEMRDWRVHRHQATMCLRKCSLSCRCVIPFKISLLKALEPSKTSMLLMAEMSVGIGSHAVAVRNFDGPCPPLSNRRFSSLLAKVRGLEDAENRDIVLTCESLQPKPAEQIPRS